MSTNRVPQRRGAWLPRSHLTATASRYHVMKLAPQKGPRSTSMWTSHSTTIEHPVYHQLLSRNNNSMDEQPKTLRELFSDAEKKRQQIESAYDSNSATFQENLSSAIATYEECLKLAERVSLFSANEGIDDVSSSDFQYVFLLPPSHA